MSEEEIVSRNGIGVPPDELRCDRHKNRSCQCKELKFKDKRFCEKHYIQRCKYEEARRIKRKMERANNKNNKNLLLIQVDKEKEEYDDDGVQETPPMTSQKRPIRCAGEEDEEDIREKKKASVIKGSELYNISEPILALQTTFVHRDFEKVERILKIGQEMEKGEVENHVVQLQKELGIYETKCAELSDELKQQKEKIIARDEELRELEFKKMAIEDELKERDLRLEEDHKIVYERERRSLERIISLLDELKNEREKLIDLKTQNRDLDCAKQRAENESEVWRKRFKELESQVMLESKGLRKVYVEPMGLSSEVSYVEEGRKSESGQSKTQSQSNCGLKGAGFSQMNITEEALSPDERVYTSANVDSICHSSKENGIAQLAEPEGRSIAREKMTYQLDGSSYKMLSSPRLGNIRPASEGINEISNSGKIMDAIPTQNIFEKVLKRTCLKQNGKENGCSSEDQFLASTAKRNWLPEVATSCSNHKDDQSDPSDNKCSPVHSACTEGEYLKELLTSSKQRLILLRHKDDNVNVNEAEDFGSDPVGLDAFVVNDSNGGI